MGKSGKKKGPPYKEPRDKYLVVTTPFTTNNAGISAWFAHMLKEPFPYARLNVVYERKNRANEDDIIVQLPREVDDVSYCLGTHIHSVFLTDRQHDTRISYIYEYDYRNQGAPSAKWHDKFPSNDPIPDPRFPIKDPYPPPILELTPFPPIKDYARPISSAVRERVAARMAAKVTPAPANVIPPASGCMPDASSSWTSTTRTSLGLNHDTRSIIPTSCSSSFNAEDLDARKFPSPLPKNTAVTVDPRLAHRTDHHKDSNSGPQRGTSELVEVKMDPYEDAEVERLLRSLSAVNKDKAQEVLGSLFAPVKEEEKPFIIPRDKDFGPDVPEEEDYKPSADLLAMFETLTEDEDGGQPEVRPEPLDTMIPEYRPSAKSLASFPAPLTGTRSPTYDGRISVKEELDHKRHDFNNHSAQIRIKEEPLEVPNHGLLGRPLSNSSTSIQRHTASGYGHQPRTQDLLIKAEPAEHASDFQQSRAYRAQSKPGPSRDPRVRPPVVSSSTHLSKRDSDHLQDGGHLSPKRIKTEYEERDFY